LRAVGLSAGVIQAGKTCSYHFGTVSKHLRQLANDRTLYPIASLTKTFTGTLLAQAQCEGKLKLDDDIRNYLDGDYPNLAFEQQPILIHHLVNHVSGLPRFLPDKPEASPDFHSDVPYPQRLHDLVAASTRADFYAGLHEVKLTTPPGTKFRYSNAAAQLAGYILESVYSSSFATWCISTSPRS
jgi:D-alanyl-D-alanine-carboxypeptidase/D-alanyl-D-alanine-endopeptidase